MGLASNYFFSSNDSERQTLYRRVTPTEAQFDAQTTRWNELAEYLLSDLKSTTGYPTRSWLQGSYKFGTQVRPTSKFGEFDIDLGIYFEWEGNPDAAGYDPSELQGLVQGCLERYANGRAEIKSIVRPPKKRCCRIHYKDNFHIDVPCYHLDPTRDHRSLATLDGWEKSDPKALYVWFRDSFEEADRAKVRRQIKYLKAWAALKWKTDAGRPSSVLLTVLGAEAAKRVPLSQPDDDLLISILNDIHRRMVANPVISNPKNKTENLNQLEHAQNLEFVERLSKFKDIADRAREAAEESTAAVIWAEAFEHFFPMPELGESSISLQAMNKSGALVPITLPDIHVTAVNKENPHLRYAGTNCIGPIPRNCTITFAIPEAWRLPHGATVEWVVRNGEGEAEAENDLGHSSGIGTTKTETSAYNGTHFMDVIFRVSGNIIGARRVTVTVRDVPIPKRNPPQPQYVRLRGRR
jgi:hypothetical protein